MSILDQLKEHINDYVDAHNQINNYERDQRNGVPTLKGFNDIVEGFSKASSALVKVKTILEQAQKDNLSNQGLTDIQKSVSRALLDTDEKFKKFFGIN